MIKLRLRLKSLPSQSESDRIQNQILFNCWTQALTVPQALSRVPLKLGSLRLRGEAHESVTELEVTTNQAETLSNPNSRLYSPNKSQTLNFFEV